MQVGVLVLWLDVRLQLRIHLEAGGRREKALKWILLGTRFDVLLETLIVGLQLRLERPHH